MPIIAAILQALDRIELKFSSFKSLNRQISEYERKVSRRLALVFPVTHSAEEQRPRARYTTGNADKPSWQVDTGLLLAIVCLRAT